MSRYKYIAWMYVCFRNILLSLPVEERTATHILQNSIISKHFGYQAHYFAVSLRPYPLIYDLPCIIWHGLALLLKLISGLILIAHKNVLKIFCIN